MNHEPECTYQPEVPGYGYTSGFGQVDRSNFRPYQPARPCTCAPLRAAYQRGREDAAKAAHAEMLRHNDQGEWLSVKDLDVLAAARGDGAE